MWWLNYFPSWVEWDVPQQGLWFLILVICIKGTFSLLRDFNVFSTVLSGQSCFDFFGWHCFSGELSTWTLCGPVHYQLLPPESYLHFLSSFRGDVIHNIHQHFSAAPFFSSAFSQTQMVWTSSFFESPWHFYVRSLCLEALLSPAILACFLVAFPFCSSLGFPQQSRDPKNWNSKQRPFSFLLTYLVDPGFLSPWSWFCISGGTRWCYFTPTLSAGIEEGKLRGTKPDLSQGEGVSKNALVSSYSSFTYPATDSLSNGLLSTYHTLEVSKQET